MKIEFSKLPGMSVLFLDYVSNSGEISKILSQNIKSQASNGGGLPQNFDQVIKKSSKNVKLTEKQNENIDKLLYNNALVAIAGQQVGFLGGPLYTIYKAATAIKIAEQNDNFVPIFWIEDNDHDNYEASEVSLFDSRFCSYRLFCQDTAKEELLSVSHRRFDDSINKRIGGIKEILKDFEYSDESVLLDDLYLPGKLWVDAFTELMQYLFGDFGLILIKASEVRKAGLFADVIKKMLDNPGETHRIINQSNAALNQSGYHIQARTNFLDIFYHYENKRLRVDKDDDNFIIADKSYNINDLKELFDSSPTEFSPRVLLRPICQDSILPVAAFVGGPSEIAYFAQLPELYDYFGLTMPAVLPRFSATIITSYVRRFSEQYFINIYDFFKPLPDLLQHKSGEAFSKDYSNIFKKAEGSILEIYQEISDEIIQLDSSIDAAAANSRNKSMKYLRRLEKKAISVYKRRNSEYFNKLQHAHNQIYPNNNLQERLISAMSFICLIGKGRFVDLVLENVDPLDFRHNIIEI